jgi:hypothetical protein
MPALIRKEVVESLIGRLFSSYQMAEVELVAAEMMDLIGHRVKSITARTPWNRRKAAELIEVTDRFILALNQRMAKEGASSRARLQPRRDGLTAQQFYLREWAAGGVYVQGRWLDAGQWAAHFSIVRMTVPLVLMLAFFVVVALSGGRVGREFFWTGMLLWLLAWGFMEMYTFQTFKMVFQQRRFDALLRGDFARFTECQRQIASEDGPWFALNREFPIWCVRGLAALALLFLLINGGAMMGSAGNEAAKLAAALSVQDANLQRQSDAVDKLAAQMDDLTADLPDEVVTEDTFASEDFEAAAPASPDVRIVAGGGAGERYIIGRVTVTVR